MWEENSGQEEEDGIQSEGYTQDISKVKQRAVLSYERDDISSRVQAELIRRIAAGTEALLRPTSASAETLIAGHLGALDKLSSRARAEVDCRIAIGTVTYLRPTITSPRKQATVYSGVLEGISGCIQAGLDWRVTANAEATLQFGNPQQDEATARSRSLDGIFKGQRDGIELPDAPAALCPLPLFATLPRERHNVALPSVVEGNLSRQKSFKQAAVPSTVPPSVDIMYPPSPSLSFKSESTEVSNHFYLEDYLTCGLFGFFRTSLLLG
jgi:hypothetical protein